MKAAGSLLVLSISEQIGTAFERSLPFLMSA
jgi:hypothetical protein